MLVGDSNSLPEITTEIRFNGVASLCFIAVSDVQICALSFSNSKTSISEAWLFSISHCIFQHSRHTALIVFNATAYFESISFTNNHEGGMVAYDSTLIFSGENIFARNSGRERGGGLSVNRCDVGFTGWSTFTNNSAGNSGGGIYSTRSSLDFNGIMTFTHNTASSFGGGFSAFLSIVTFTSTTTFSYNSAKYGGGISFANSNLAFSGSSIFTLNKAVDFGGALGVFSDIFTRITGVHRGANSNTTASFHGESKFVDNSAGLGGGACAVHLYSSLSFNGNNTFSNNSAVQHGGGFSISSSTVMLVGITSLTHNSAGYYGGGLWVQNGSGAFLGNSTFTGNSAKNGGAIGALLSNLSLCGNTSFTKNSAVDYGGGVFVLKGKVVLSNSTSFMNNVAEITGGGLYIQNSSGIFNGYNAYIRNSAGNRGGGIAARGGSILEFNGISNFANNLATSYGGGINAQDSKVIFSGEGVFMHNIAGQYNGGGILAANCTGIFNGSNSFINNSAGYGGGGVYGIAGSALDFHGVNNFTDNSAETGSGLQGVNCRINFYGRNTFMYNLANQSGGGVLTKNVTGVFRGDSIFTHNTAGFSGGGVAAIKNCTLDFSGYIRFIDNFAGHFGGGFYAEYINGAESSGGDLNAQNVSNLNFSGDNNIISTELTGDGMNVRLDLRNSTQNMTVDGEGGGNTKFIHNTVTVGYEGGSLAVYNSNVSFSEESYFIGNTANYAGGGLAILGSSTFIFNNNITFVNNSAKNGGGLIAVNCSFRFNGATVFANNSAEEIGGGLVAKKCSGVFHGNNTFIGNLAINAGGGAAILDSSLEFCENTSFMGNFVGGFGAGINAGNSHVVFRGTSRFINNFADGGGGAAYPVGSFLTFIGRTSFIENFAKFYGGAIFSIFQPFGVIRSAVKFNGTVEFVGNVAGNGGGALALWNYTAVFIGRCTFSHNTARSGGALIGSNPKCYFFPNSSVQFKNNYAVQRGGAINHLDDPFYKCLLLSRQFEATKLLIPCFFRIPQESEPQIELVFKNNTAGEAGDSLYGGAIDTCLAYSIEGTQLGYNVFDSLSTITDNSTTSSVSSDPFHACACIDNQPDCSILLLKRETYPGATFLISAVGVGQRNGTVPAVIRAELGIKSQAKLDDLQKAQEIEQHCSILRYTVYSPAALEEVNLYAEGPCPRLGDPLTAFVKLRKCPAGFAMNDSKNACVCEERLLKYTSSCNITDATIEHSGNFWVGYSNSSSGLILHPHCPFEYCATEIIRFTLEDSDKQCRYNRTGLLCGACKPGLSIALATAECMVCSNSHLSLLLAFALAGVVLVIFLFACKLTVSVGTLNGLILYTNIVVINHSTFFPNGDTNILTVFIAWMNLDLGIKTCLHDGMDAYARTWLQFVFPVYIWTLVGLIIIASYYSTKIARILSGTNPVSVLATLFLLSYAKLLRTTIAVLSFTSLEYPNNSRVTVWLADGNIEYFHGKHIPLAIVALVVFLLLLFPFTLLLMFGQWIQANSTRRMFSWACDPRVTAVLDAYHAPFNRDTRYWIGLLLLLRFALFLVFACNVLGDPSLNLLAISASVVGLQTVMKFIGDIYKNRYLDILESSFILNLGILAVGTYQVEQGGGSQMALYCTSVGMAFATFIGITLYHVLLQLKGSRLWNSLQYYFKHERRWVAIPTEATMEENMHISGFAPTVSYINLREPLELISSCK